MSASSTASESTSSVDTSSVTQAINNLQQVYDFATQTSSEITVIKVEGDECLDASQQRPNIA